MLIDGPLPVWSLHLDCELTAEFAHSTTQFDALTNRILEATRDAFTSAGTELLNPLDVDVTYTRSADTFRVLTSEAAESLTDPLLVALREWHRMRNAK
jgi:hypothetical protein